MTSQIFPKRKNRKDPNKEERLAAALLQVLELEGRPLSREKAKSMSPREIIALFHCDHYPVTVANGGSNHPTNLNFKLVKDHQEKTNTVDIPEIAKGKRCGEAHEAFRRRVLAKQAGEPIERPEPKIRSRGFPSKEQRKQLKQRYART